MEITLATWNPDKLAWMTDGLRPAGLPIRSVSQDEVPDVEETGDSCEANAILKASAVREVITDGIIAAEDSGLFIPALNGFPGVRTARFVPGSDEDRSLLLLERMRHVPRNQRIACFVSAVAIMFPDGTLKVFRGELHGEIASTAAGNYSEGYDRIFLLPSGETLASIPADARHSRDHRRQALASASDGIRVWLEDRPR